METKELIEQKKRELSELKQQAKAEKFEEKEKAKAKKQLERDDKKVLKTKLDLILRAIYDFRKLKAAQKKEVDILDKIQLILHNESDSQ